MSTIVLMERPSCMSHICLLRRMPMRSRILSCDQWNDKCMYKMWSEKYVITLISYMLLKVYFTETCGKHEVLVKCANPCQPSCSWKDRPACPTFACSEGCACRKNFYRATNDTNSACIKCKRRCTWFFSMLFYINNPAI